MKDDLRYSPTDCFHTFPFPEDFETDAKLEAVGKEYSEYRAALMVRNDEGLTKTYNRFHDPNETSPDIKKLQELHAAMDRAVLDTWDIVLARLLELNKQRAEEERLSGAAAEGKQTNSSRRKRKAKGDGPQLFG